MKKGLQSIGAYPSCYSGLTTIGSTIINCTPTPTRNRTPTPIVSGPTPTSCPVTRSSNLSPNGSCVSSVLRSHTLSSISGSAGHQSGWSSTKSWEITLGCYSLQTARCQPGFDKKKQQPVLMCDALPKCVAHLHISQN